MSDFKKLSKEDKIYNLNLTKENLQKKISNLQKQIDAIETKIAKLSDSKVN